MSAVVAAVAAMAVLAALATCFAGFFRAELVCRSLFVSGLTTLTGDLALFVLVHRGEATVAGRTLILLICHHELLVVNRSYQNMPSNRSGRDVVQAYEVHAIDSIGDGRNPVNEIADGFARSSEDEPLTNVARLRPLKGEWLR